MHIVDQRIGDSVYESRFVDEFVPGIDRQLACDQRCAGSVSIFDDFHQIATLRRGHVFRPPVVENEQVCFDELAKHAREAPVVMCQLQFRKEPRQAHADHGGIVTTGSLPQAAGQPDFADPTGAGDQQVALFFDLSARGGLLGQGFVKTTRGAEIYSFDACTTVTKLGGA